MWNPGVAEIIPVNAINLTSTEVLYDFDGPLIFISRVGFHESLFVFCESHDFNLRFLCSKLTGKVRDALLMGNLSVRGALANSFSALVETDSSLSVQRYWDLKFDQVPEDLLPRRSVGLTPGFGWVPDEIEQADAFFSVRFSGDRMKAEKMPFQTLRKLTADVYEAARRFLAPQELARARSETFDFIVNEPAFGSLVLALDRPRINLEAAKRLYKTRQVDLDAVNDGFEARLQRFFDILGTLQTKSLSNTDIQGDDEITFVENLLNILPSEASEFDSVEFSGVSRGKRRHASLSLESSKRIRSDLESISGAERDIHGVVSIVNDNSGSFVVNSITGRQVTCYFDSDPHIFQGERERLTTGVVVTVTGRFNRRRQRDLLYSVTRVFFHDAAD